MSLHTEWIRYGDARQFSGYLTHPERMTDGQPAVVVIQEIWGVDEHIKNVADRFAQAGYVALAPDLYARDGARLPGFEAEAIDAVKRFLNSVSPAVWHDAGERDRAMEKLPEPEQSQVRRTFSQLFQSDLDSHRPQLLASTDYLRNSYAVTKGQAVVSVGFCLGGALSARLASDDAQLAGAAIFYGRAPTEEQMKQIQCPVRGYYGALDHNITDKVPAFAEMMKQLGKDFAYRVYEGAPHAFFNDTRASYHAAAARSAFAEVLTFFHHVVDKNR
ncbi:dienelactone hydrolase family protein [Alicyclobacillus acidiphilus]|uniref:dienelactone hydrolase family protein n=1 Tax=Alicyclobacillus acidiphilus TaxID=182455 RepID=UPI0008371C69|nr:dienelactone hydrolase family protein [Alicyclobacillus acidiphilus]